jgi:hypothetical protein
MMGGKLKAQALAAENPSYLGFYKKPKSAR